MQECCVHISYRVYTFLHDWDDEVCTIITIFLKPRPFNAPHLDEKVVRKIAGCTFNRVDFLIQ